MVVSRIVDVMLAGSDADTEVGAVVIFGVTDEEDGDSEAVAEEITGPTEDVLEAMVETDEVGAEVKADERDDGKPGTLDEDVM
jgi:hypothetical protein